MDWDDLNPKQPARAITVGEDLSAMSIAELDARVAALQAEIARVEAERRTKAARSAAADQLFKR